MADTALLRAENAVPYAGQYRGFPGWHAIVSSNDATDARVRGSIGGIGPDGAPYHFCGTVEKLFQLQATGLVDVSDTVPPPPAYSLGAQDRWNFAQYADVIAAAGGLGQKIQGFVLGTSTEFKDIDDPVAFGGSGTAPAARYVWPIGRQLFATHLSTDPNAVHFGAIDNPFAWPAPGTGTAVFSDLRSLPGGGTKINGLCGYGEVGGILKDESLWRADFVGGDVAWEFRQVVEGMGLLVPGLVIAHEGVVLFFSEHGWKLWGYANSLEHVGDGVIDRWFEENWDANYPERFSVAMDSDRNMALIHFVGSGHVGGEPNRTLLFHFPTRQWATLEGLSIEHVTLAFQPTAVITLDSMEQSTLGSKTGSPDDPLAPTKTYVGGYAVGSHQLGLFNGSSLEMLLETGDVSHATGARSMVSVVRPMVDTEAGYAARVAVGVRSRRTEDPLFGAEQTQANDGECYFRSDGRYHRYRVRVPAGAPDIQAMGLEVDLEVDGSMR